MQFHIKCSAASSRLHISRQLNVNIYRFTFNSHLHIHIFTLFSMYYFMQPNIFCKQSMVKFKLVLEIIHNTVTPIFFVSKISRKYCKPVLEIIHNTVACFRSRCHCKKLIIPNLRGIAIYLLNKSFEKFSWKHSCAIFRLRAIQLYLKRRFQTWKELWKLYILCSVPFTIWALILWLTSVYYAVCTSSRM